MSVDDQKRIDDIRRKTQNQEIVWLCDLAVDQANEINEVKAILAGQDIEPSPRCAIIGKAVATDTSKDYLREIVKKRRAEKKPTPDAGGEAL
jgi:hypothetical protein